MPPVTPSLHVVFGAGQIGPHLARLLEARGHDVRLVRRRPEDSRDGIPVVSGDAGDTAFAQRATEGATAIYHCMNPAYSTRTWAEELPRIASSLIAAAGRSGARLVVLDNLYMVGRPGAMIDEDTPDHPVSRKGEIRARPHTYHFTRDVAAGSLYSPKLPTMRGAGGCCRARPPTPRAGWCAGSRTRSAARSRSSHHAR